MSENKRQNDVSYSALTGFHRAMPIILFATAVFIGLCFIMQDIGALGRAISGFLSGLFSFGAYLIPFFIAIHAIFYPRDIANKTLLSRVIFSLVALITVSSLGYCISMWGEELSFSLSEFYRLGKKNTGGGFIGSIIAYLIIKIIGNVGLIIIAFAVFALYLSFFFAKGRGTASRVGFTFLKGIVNLGAFVEDKIKKAVAGLKKSKSNKKINEDNRKTEELCDDEFFGTDNSVQRLEIPKLGILETRSDKTIENRPTLQDKVRPGTRVIGNYTENNQKNDANEGAEFTFDTFHESEAESKSKIFDPKRDIVIDFNGADNDKKTSLSDFEADGRADNIFTADFDPFKMAINEDLASRPSSKAEELKKRSTPTINESLSELTEEDAKRARDIAAFERRKAQIIANRRAQDVPAKSESDFEIRSKNIDFRQNDAEIISDVVEEDPVTIHIEKTEVSKAIEEASRPSYVDYIREDERITSYGRSLSNSESENAVSYREIQQQNYARAASFAHHTYTTDVKLTEGESKEDVTFSTCTEDSDNERTNLPLDVSEDSVTEEVENAFASREEPIIREFSPIEEEESFVFDIGEGEEAAQLKTERTMLSDTEEFFIEDEEDIEEEALYEEATEDEELDGQWNTYEIPEEERNPRVIEQRAMFTVLREQDNAEKPVLLSENNEEDYEDEDLSRDEDVSLDEEEKSEYGVSFEIEPRVENVTKKAEQKPATPQKAKPDFSKYVFPPIDLLGIEVTHNDDEINAEIQENTRILIETLESFNVTASIKGVDRGPRITRYEVVPARGVKVKEITGRFEDIELYLATEGIRMEAPIPGKSAIGFEIPNKHPATVRLRELLETDEFTNAKSKTFVSIGKDVAGSPIYGDIAKYPHALICGATGMGKSVCINSILVSMLYKARPDEVKLIMIDPKKVEFKIYSGIPHLLIPVITESKQAAGALMWAVGEMERRYELIEQHNVRNIEAYNQKAAEDPSIGEKLPTIVIVIDELADLMMQVRDPVEDLIQRIAQKARAAGIHLLIGTQRPSVQVITGAIKANIPSRISCKVTSQVDSRTIFDMGGAEKLLSRGDMLYWPVDRTAALRVQGAFVTDSEVEAVMNFIKNESDGNTYDDEVMAEINKAAQKCSNKKGGGAADDDEDDGEEQTGYYNDQRFLDAVELAIRSKKISTSLLQRKLSIGYGKAAKYIDQMEEIGVVSEPNGQRPRDVLISMDEWHEKLSRVDID